VDGRQNDAFSCFTGALKHLRKLNGYGADYAGKEITNFVQLRNFFVHHLGSKEAENFLNESDMLFYLKLTISILILNRIGVSDIVFDKNFQGISVFDESVRYGNYISNMLKANEL